MKLLNLFHLNIHAIPQSHGLRCIQPLPNNEARFHAQPLFSYPFLGNKPSPIQPEWTLPVAEAAAEQIRAKVKIVVADETTFDVLSAVALVLERYDLLQCA